MVEKINKEVDPNIFALSKSTITVLWFLFLKLNSQKLPAVTVRSREIQILLICWDSLMHVPWDLVEVTVVIESIRPNDMKDLAILLILISLLVSNVTTMENLSWTNRFMKLTKSWQKDFLRQIFLLIFLKYCHYWA